MILQLLRLASISSPDVWYAPHFRVNGVTPPDLFPLLTTPETSWPALANRTHTFKLFLDMLYESGAHGLPPGAGTTDGELASLIATLKRRDIRVGLEIGGARWQRDRCDEAAALDFAATEQTHVSRWLRLGGTIDSATTDHALTWNIRGPDSPSPIPGKKSTLCDPPVPMASRIDIVAQVFASWRAFFGEATSLGFIESLGYWEIQGPDGTNFTNTDPVHLSNISGWIPKLDDVTTQFLAAAKRHNPTEFRKTPLVDHYQIDCGMSVVEYDTVKYGLAPAAADGSKVNYGRLLGAEAVMKKNGLATGVIANAFRAGNRGHECLAGCEAALTPSRSAALRTLNFTSGYMAQPKRRRSSYVLFEQWQPYPNRTGPASRRDSNMWMATRAAELVVLTEQPPPVPCNASAKLPCGCCGYCDAKATPPQCEPVPCPSPPPLTPTSPEDAPSAGEVTGIVFGTNFSTCEVQGRPAVFGKVKVGTCVDVATSTMPPAAIWRKTANEFESFNITATACSCGMCVIEVDTFLDATCRMKIDAFVDSSMCRTGYDGSVVGLIPFEG